MPGVVHQHLDRAERRLDLGERGVDRVGVLDRRAHCERRRAGGLDRALRSPSRPSSSCE